MPSANGTVSSSIIDGKADTEEHDSVVLLSVLKGGRVAGSCTGTMVAPNLVLTARHCVSDTDEGVLCRVDGTAYSGGKVTKQHSPQELLVYTGKLAILGIANPESAEAKGKQIIVENTTTLCNADLAFIVLDRELDTPVATIRTKERVRQGESLTAVGWGVTEQGRQPNKRMQRAGVKVTGVGPLVLDERANIGLGDSEFSVGEAFCSGDSGGPSFGSTGAVVGVVSRGGGSSQDPSNPAANCIGSDVVGFYTHLAKKGELVQKAFDAAGYAPREEGAAPGKAKGATCEQNAECSTNACIDGVCVGRCDSEGKCADENQVCETKNDIKVCVPKSDEPPPRQADAGAAAASSAAAPTTTTITKTGCSSAPRGSTQSSLFALAMAPLAMLMLRRARRSTANHDLRVRNEAPRSKP